MRQPITPILYGVLCFHLLLSTTVAQVDEQQRQMAVRKGLEYMKVRGQDSDGAVSPRIGIGLTALAATAMMRNGVTTSDPALAKALNLVSSSARLNGGIYPDGSRLMMYETCVAMMCLKEANDAGQYDQILGRAAGFIKGEQFTEEKGTSPADNEYGGAGYGGKSRPDLSNTAYFIDALESLGDPEHDEAIQKALAFVSRCQNLESEYNSTAGAAKIDDGGFHYNVTEEGASPAGQTPDGGLRSYGSMTYAGFKSMLHAGLDEEDPRVVAAKTWIQTHYTVTENPGLGEAGLYYYYNLLARALSIAKIDELEDADGNKHNWRAELVEHLVSLQSEDGSWTNQNERWMESDPNLATTFALLALSYCEEE